MQANQRAREKHYSLVWYQANNNYDNYNGSNDYHNIELTIHIPPARFSHQLRGLVHSPRL